MGDGAQQGWAGTAEFGAQRTIFCQFCYRAAILTAPKCAAMTRRLSAPRSTKAHHLEVDPSDLRLAVLTAEVMRVPGGLFPSAAAVRYALAWPTAWASSTDCRGGCNQKEPKITGQASLRMLSDIKLYALRYERPLRGVCRADEGSMLSRRD